MMIDDKVIEASSNSLKMLDEYGPVSITVFFTIMVLIIVAIFIKYLLKGMETTVENNTKVMENLNNNMNRDFSDIKHKQSVIHEDIREILHTTRYKYSINDFDIKGFVNEKR